MLNSIISDCVLLEQGTMTTTIPDLKVHPEACSPSKFQPRPQPAGQGVKVKATEVVGKDSFRAEILTGIHMGVLPDRFQSVPRLDGAELNITVGNKL